MKIDLTKYAHLEQVRMIDGSIHLRQNGVLHNDVGPSIIYQSNKVYIFHLDGIRMVTVHPVNGVMKIEPNIPISNFTVHKAITMAIDFCNEYNLEYCVVVQPEDNQ